MSTTSPPLPRLALFLSDGRKVLFPPETKTLVIGREEDRCDLVLPGKLVSSQHCSLCGSVLRDMSSSLGVTKVNGKAIKEVELHLGDVITISHHTVQHETILVNSIDLGFLTLRNVSSLDLGYLTLRNRE